MVRSSRSAGVWVAATEGKRLSGQGSETTSSRVAGSAASAMCTASPSLHRLDSVASPAAMPSTAWRQVSASTTTRGQGRCAATLAPFSVRAAMKVMGLSSPPRRRRAA